VPTIKIPEIKIPTIDIPKTPFFTPYSLTGKVPGCNQYHRDLETSRNPSLLWADPNGVSTNCPEGRIPSFNPMRYDSNELIYTEPKATQQQSIPQQVKIKPPQRKEKEEDFFIDCPGPKDQKMGDFRNDKRLERVIGWKLSDNGKDCITLYESVTFVESVLPSTSAALNVATISLIAASAPLLLNVIKGASKTLFKKILTRKKKENDDGVKPD
tara:strand:- start:1524 stop:2162 length:639 start_codon:yes stop_codon:yes gene_type:complete